MRDPKETSLLFPVSPDGRIPVNGIQLLVVSVDGDRSSDTLGQMHQLTEFMKSGTASVAEAWFNSFGPSPFVTNQSQNISSDVRIEHARTCPFN